MESATLVISRCRAHARWQSRLGRILTSPFNFNSGAESKASTLLTRQCFREDDNEPQDVAAIACDTWEPTQFAPNPRIRRRPRFPAPSQINEYIFPTTSTQSGNSHIFERFEPLF